MNADSLQMITIPLTLETLQAEINAHLKAIDELRADRNRIVIDALAIGIPYRTITKWTGLSRSGVIRIQAEAGLRK